MRDFGVKNMSTGTLTLTQNSTAVVGSGTLFTTDSEMGGVIFVSLDGVNHTLVVSSIASDEQLTLARAYTGATQSGIAWTAIPRDALIGIHAQLAADNAWARRAAVLDKQNWYQVFSADGTITVTLPDGSTFTGSSWKTIIEAMENKANKADIPNIVAEGITWNNPADAGLAIGTSAIRTNFSGTNNVYYKIARVKMLQSADTIGIRIFGGSGYNAGAPSQACVHDIILRTSNNNPFSINPVCIANAHTSFNSAIQAVYAVHETGDIWEIWIKASSIHMAGVTMQVCCPANTGRAEVINFGNLGNSATEPENAITNATWRNVSVPWAAGGFTVDSNGFVKTASPILKLKAAESDCGDAFSSGAIYHDDISAANAECSGVRAVQVSTGRYEITGSKGLASEGWQLEIPQDINGNRLCFVETDFKNDVLIVQISKRKFDVETGDIIAGEAIDIPLDRWIDFRLSIPTDGDNV
jgi:hypothetical protein